MTPLTPTFKPSLDQVLSSHTRRFGPLAPGRYRLVANDLQGREVERQVTLGADDMVLDVRFD